MKIIVAGGREFNNYELLSRKLNHLFQNLKDIEIVSGKARGADRLGEKWARENGHPVKPFPADWKTYDLGAGPIRNEEMARYADGCVCFWNGVSNGTRDMIKRAKAHKLKLTVIRY